MDVSPSRCAGTETQWKEAQGRVVTKQYQRNIWRRKMTTNPVVQHSNLDLSLNCSTAAQTPAGCHNHRSPTGGAGRACLHGDPGPWPWRSPGWVWDQDSLPLHWVSGKSCCSVPGKTWTQFEGKQGFISCLVQKISTKSDFSLVPPPLYVFYISAYKEIGIWTDFVTRRKDSISVLLITSLIRSYI